MTIFNAYQSAKSGETICLPDRFDWFAFFMPPVWAIAHQLWRELALMGAGIVVLALAAGFFDLPFVALYLAGALWLGFEAHQIHGRALLRQGFVQTGALSAPDRVEAETEVLSRQTGSA